MAQEPNLHRHFHGGRVAGDLQTIQRRLREILGGGWGSDEALACALACVIEFPEDYGAAIKRGANTSGDSDSIASIAGAISGAFLGTEAIEKDWRKRIENRRALINLSKKLYLAHQK